MKKALAILLALSMVFAAFSDEPATDFSVVSFGGSATLEWTTDLENETNGFNNSAEAKIKINVVNGGDKATSGDGVWGELKIVTDGDGNKEYTNGSFVAPVTAPMTVKVDTAKIHFVDGDNTVVLNILNQDLGLGGVVLPTAAAPETKSTAYNVNKDKALTNGFAIEASAKDLGSVNLKVMDNGSTAKNDAKEYGFAADATLTAVENVNVKAGFAYSTANELSAIVASADYKYAIDDKLYVKPVVAYAMMDEAKALEAGLLFGWGAEGQKPEFALLNKDSDKFADGVSVTYKNDLAEEATQEIVIGAYDSTLVEGLKVGAEYKTTLDDFGTGNLATGVKYSTDIDIFTLSGEFGYTTKVGTKDSDNYIYSAEVKTDKVIDNTTVYGKYEGGKDNKGKITVGAKIAL